MYQLILRLWLHIKTKRKVQIVWVIILMLFSSVAEVISISSVIPFLTALTRPEKIFEYKMILDCLSRIGIESSSQLLLPLTILFSIAVLIAGGIRTFLLWNQIKVSHSIGSDIGVDMYRRTLFQPYSVHISRNSSEIISGISQKAGGVVGGTIMPLMMMISSIFILLTLFVALIYINYKIALSCFGFFGFAYLILILLTKHRLLEEGKRMNKESSQIIKLLQEGLGSIRDILIDGNQEEYSEIYRRSDLGLRNARARIQFVSGFPKFAMETMGMIFIALLAFYLTMKQGGITSAIPVLGAMALGAQRILPLFHQIYASWSSMRGGQASLLDSINLLDQRMPTCNRKKIKTLNFLDSIRVENVKYHYPNNKIWVLRNINFDIKKGSRIGIIGVTGSGKSTLLDILMGLLIPTEGQILVDEIPIDASSMNAWQKKIAHVPQSIYITDASIAENIAFGVALASIDMDRVRDSAKKAQLSSAINEWPNRYNTRVGEQGIRLSGGQRQRLAIARALYKKTDILVFDEATSALDTKTELAVMKSINSLGKHLTIILVAHRLSTLKCCDRIVSISHGKIDFLGSYDEIIKKKKVSH